MTSGLNEPTFFNGVAPGRPHIQQYLDGANWSLCIIKGKEKWMFDGKEKATVLEDSGSKSECCG